MRVLGNRLQQNVTSGSAGTSQLNVDNSNRITGAPANCTAANAYCYDAAGDLLNDGFHQYTYDAESRIRQVDGGATTYTYDADGQRVRKDFNQFLVGNSSAAPVGTWNAWYSDIAIVSADGTVAPIYTGQASTSFQFVSTSSPMATNLSASVTHDSTIGANAQLTTNYYHGDQIGSSRLS